MDVPTELISLAIGGAGALLLTNTWKINRMGMILKDHIETEETNDKRIRRQLHVIRKKLPNGEVEKTFAMVAELHGYFEDEIREWKLGKVNKAVQAEELLEEPDGEDDLKLEE